LGIESSERKNLVAEKNHTKLFTYYKEKVCTIKNIQPLIDFINSKENIAITCFEKDHNLCHRGTLSQYVKKELAELKAKEDKVNELKSWKKDVDEVVSPTQLKEYIKDINDLKSFKTVAITVWAIVQFLTAIGIAVARFFK
jgi:transcriptional accessory protein Tex/SPT6